METNNISEEQPTVDVQPSINAQDATGESTTAENAKPLDYKNEIEKWKSHSRKWEARAKELQQHIDNMPDSIAKLSAENKRYRIKAREADAKYEEAQQKYAEDMQTVTIDRDHLKAQVKQLNYRIIADSIKLANNQNIERLNENETLLANGRRSNKNVDPIALADFLNNSKNLQEFLQESSYCKKLASDKNLKELNFNNLINADFDRLRSELASYIYKKFPYMMFMPQKPESDAFSLGDEYELLQNMKNAKKGTISSALAYLRH